MAKVITSTDWHLEGVSVAVRKALAAYSMLEGIKQGEAVDNLLRVTLKKKGLL